MNETSLKKVVERAVRPVRASEARKLQMRVELLGHLTGLYEEERARLGDDAAAFEAACARFGDPVELSQELDRSVGFWGRWAWGEERIVNGLDRLCGYREDRSLAWHIGRAAATSIVAGVLAVGLIVLLSFVVPDRRMTLDQAKFLLPVLFYFVAMNFVLHLASLALVSDFFDLERPRWRRALLHAIGCVAAMTTLFVTMNWAILDDIGTLLPQLPIIVLVHALIPTGLILAIRSGDHDARPYREWRRLRLDE
jgi:hypothetical protein